jgi:hypothetical protein
MLHTEHSAVALLVDVLQHVAVVDLTRGGLLSPRVVTDLNVGNLIGFDNLTGAG